MNPSPSQFIVASRCLFCIAISIITFLALTSKTDLLIFSLWDKLLHACAFFTLALLLDYSFPHTPYRIAKPLGLFIYGLALEGLQHYLPSRYASLSDIAANLAGLFVYGLLCARIARLNWFASYKRNNL